MAPAIIARHQRQRQNTSYRSQPPMQRWKAAHAEAVAAPHPTWRSQMISFSADAASSVLLGPAAATSGGRSSAQRSSLSATSSSLPAQEQAAVQDQRGGRQAGREAGRGARVHGLTRGRLQAGPGGGQPAVHVGHQLGQRRQHPGQQVAVCRGDQQRREAHSCSNTAIAPNSPSESYSTIASPPPPHSPSPAQFLMCGMRMCRISIRTCW